MINATRVESRCGMNVRQHRRRQLSQSRRKSRRLGSRAWSSAQIGTCEVHQDITVSIVFLSSIPQLLTVDPDAFATRKHSREEDTSPSPCAKRTRILSLNEHVNAGIVSSNPDAQPMSPFTSPSPLPAQMDLDTPTHASDQTDVTSVGPDQVDLDVFTHTNNLVHLESEIQELWSRLDDISEQYRGKLADLEKQIAELEDGRQRDLQVIRNRLDGLEKKRRRMVAGLGVRRRLF